MSDEKKSKPREKPILPLAGFKGKKPAAPAWFARAIKCPFTDHQIQVRSTSISYRLWGEAGKPGLILVHGGVAHKGWWDFIAPYFLCEFQVLALDLSGMGQSQWRENYDIPTYAEEVLECARHAGFYDADQKPWLVGHSFGGFVTMGFAALHGSELSGAVIIDTPIRPPKEQRRSSPPSRGGKVYIDLVQALGRFRLLPGQPCENAFLLDHIARQALHEVDGGWTWRFDPQLWQKMRYDMRAAVEMVGEISCPFSLIRGEQSSLVTDELWAFMKLAFPDSDQHISIPESLHHVPLDQPLALVSALRAIISPRI